MIPHVCGVITISLRNPPRRPDIQPLGGYGHYRRVAVKVAVMSSCSNHFVQNVVSHVIINITKKLLLTRPNVEISPYR